MLNFMKTSLSFKSSFSNRKDGQTKGQAGGQTDTADEANSRFSQFCERT